MVNISLDHIKAIIKSAIASATRYKPNLEVTDPDDPRYIAGKVPEEKITCLATVAKSGDYNDLTNIPSKLCRDSANYDKPGVVEGLLTGAFGEYSHAEGIFSTAHGNCSHAEGYYTNVHGNYSHVEGNDTYAIGDCQHVQGRYNIESSKYCHIVGNGTSTTTRSNAHTLDWSGNAWYAGTVEGTAMIVKSSTTDSTKRFKITVDDSGTISATEVTA